MSSNLLRLNPHLQKRKKTPPADPLPAELPPWRTLANLHNVRQNDAEQAIQAGFVRVAKGSWEIESGCPVREGLGAQGLHAFWAQSHPLDTFRTCDACPHSIQS